jgi:hypothetical protein
MAIRAIQTLTKIKGIVVSKIGPAWITGILLVGQLATLALADEDPGVAKELTAVIAAEQLSCGKVMHFDTQGTRDYLVHCKDGSIYEVVANAEGKLVATLIAKKVQPVK